jgi:thiol-disulfide isomerase/thioredoxin
VEGNADWKNDVHLLVLKQPPGPKPPSHEDYFDTEEFQKAFAEYRNNEQFERRRAERSYWVNFNPDGSFRIDDVPPGTYELRINVTEPLKPGENRWGPVPPDKVLASLTREVIVPQPASGQSDQPLDLGLLELPWKGPQQTAPAISMVTQTLDEKSFSLENLRGKFVLLNFWSTWSKASHQQMEFVKALRSKFKTNSQVVFIDVNLGEDPSRVRQFIKQNQSSAEQAILTGPALAAITEQLAVDSLPAAFLLNPKGQVISRDLTDSSLERALQSALNRYSTANKE